ncbi:sulfur oxidation c-type cytochrome SoxX [Thiohalorhabdus sp.]|uniref:sulfur oxidation c-type cytochrome SoxX n=1 Tax=Thiohalorhabdus sp. TaxID=3094134 RepID=UPI002FC2F98F
MKAGESHMKKDIPRSQYTEMSSEKLAEYLIFNRGFKVDQEIPENQGGGTTADRMKQDRIQEACSQLNGQAPDSSTAQKVQKIAKNSVQYPEGGVELGDWKEGQALAEDAYGWRVAHKVDDHNKRDPGGLCMNCHVFESDKKGRSGSIGVGLVGYGNKRGQGEETLRYTYRQIYNSHTNYPCGHMPRFGAKGLLTQEQIGDLMAYLLDPESPVNQ